MSWIVAVVAVLIFLFTGIFYYIYNFSEKPKNLRADWADSQVRLTWYGSDNAETFRVSYRSTSGNGNWHTASCCSTTSTSITLTNGIYYDIVVNGENWLGSSFSSNIISGRTRASSPSNLLASYDPNRGNSISLVWTSVENSTGYIVRRATSSDDAISSIIKTLGYSSSTKTEDASFTFGVSYYYTVTSLDHGGEAGRSDHAFVCPRISPPTLFSATIPNNISGTIVLNWMPVSNSIGYNICREQAENISFSNHKSVLAKLTDPNTSSFIDRGLRNNVKYLYWIASEDAAGISLQSSAISGIPKLPPPSNLCAEPLHENAAVLLSWTDVLGASGYRIERKSCGTRAKMIAQIKNGSTTKYVDIEKMTYNVTYSYTIYAVDKIVESLPSSDVATATLLTVVPPKISISRLAVRYGDLTTEKVDAIVVCSTSEILKRSVLGAAGSTVAKDLTDGNNMNADICTAVSAGLLPCKKVIFVSWTPGSTITTDLEESIKNFVATAVQKAQEIGCNTLAFPAIGCGGYNCDVEVVSKAMITEAYEQLQLDTSACKQISFIIEKNKTQIYDIFCQHPKLQEPLSQPSAKRAILLPTTWQPMNDIYALQQTVSESADEYRSILKAFKETMNEWYAIRVNRIMRIQNERWACQYQLHKEDFRRRLNQDTEQKLYHGCPNNDSTIQSIIEHGFNRSLAGSQHGTAYGHGVYFSSKANESHQYTAVHATTGERTMFVCSVLLGKSILGDSTMRMCPSGYDTTTNGSSIHVIYHDAQAYADYIILYR